MAALTITAANVRYTSNTVSKKVTAGETLTPMMPVYKNTDGEYYKAANTGSTPAAAVGLCLNYAEDGVQFEMVTSGGIVIGSTLSAGQILVVGAAGIIQLASDNGVGKYVRNIGQTTSTTVLDVDFGTTTPTAVV